MKFSKKLHAVAALSILAILSSCSKDKLPEEGDVEDASTIKELFQEIRQKAIDKDYESIESNIYPLEPSSAVGKGSVEWITEGIRNPTDDERVDNGFNDDAISIIINHSSQFVPINKSLIFEPMKKEFLERLQDRLEGMPFATALKGGGKGIFVLTAPKRKSMILVFKSDGVFKLVWWKEMLGVANGL